MKIALTNKQAYALLRLLNNELAQSDQPIEDRRPLTLSRHETKLLAEVKIKLENGS